MNRVRRHLSFENVLVTAVAFIVLAGGTAFAASQLGKSSVGKKQLKGNAVTTAKIKKNAVTKAKIKNGAVDGTKVKDGSLTNAELNSADVPFGRALLTAQSSGTATVGAPPEFGVLPLSNASYTQQAGRDDTVAGAVDISFDSKCEAPRVVLAYVQLDDPNPALPSSADEIVAAGQWIEEKGAGGGGAMRLNIGPYGLAGSPQTTTDTPHTLSLIIAGGCKGGTVTATNATIQVSGVK